MQEQTTSSSLRGSARQSVAEKWAKRRRQKPSKTTTNDVNTNTAAPQQMKPPPCVIPLCVVLRRSWKEAMKGFQQQQQQRRSKVEASSTTTIKAERTSFPSVLSILQAHELKNQVESTDPTLLSVLPKEVYNLEQAIQNMSQSRSRAFWLLDLAAIVQTHVHWRKRLPKSVQMVYSTKHNANPKLLQVLQRLGVGLQVCTKYELLQVYQSLRKDGEFFGETTNAPNLNSNCIQVWDDGSILAKPNSFYRALILDHCRRGKSAKPPPLVVDGHEEVLRILSALQCMAKRRNQKLPRLEFVLRMNNDLLVSEESGISAEECWKATYQAAKDSLHDVALVGVNLEVPTSTTELKKFLSSLTLLLESVRSSCFDSDQDCHCHLTCQKVDPLLLEWLIEQQQQLKTSACGRRTTTTLDVSHLLVANAGALCTRIIGVKPRTEPAMIHYYIDDGCYGSLANVGQSAIRPLPLQTNSSVGAEQTLMKQEQLSVVWGPTCDGLDKVCSDILLPKLSRDDWLVFGDLGFCNVGTNFNGFEPPDIVFCVLGGYIHSSS